MPTRTSLKRRTSIDGVGDERVVLQGNKRKGTANAKYLNFCPQYMCFHPLHRHCADTDCHHTPEMRVVNGRDIAGVLSMHVKRGTNGLRVKKIIRSDKYLHLNQTNLH